MLKIGDLLIKNNSLFNHLYILNQEFDIIPAEKHFGMSINYIDLQESRLQFVQELINTILDWVYSKSKQDKILNALLLEGRTIGNSYSELISTAHNKFRPADDGSLLHGQFGELLLSNCIQRFFGAVPILRKMPITTSPNHERFGADAIHYNYVNGENQIYLGEAKSYTSKYKFNEAFEDAIDSILSTYNNIFKELRLYLHEDFLEPELQAIATDLINGKLRAVKMRLVSIVAYDENKKICGSTEGDIKSCIKKIICERFSNYDNSKIDIPLNIILKRITYIIFPVWKFEDLLDEFARNIKK